MGTEAKFVKKSSTLRPRRESNSHDPFDLRRSMTMSYPSASMWRERTLWTAAGWTWIRRSVMAEMDIRRLLIALSVRAAGARWRPELRILVQLAPCDRTPHRITTKEIS